MKTFIRQATKLVGLTLITSPFVWMWVTGIVELGVWEGLKASAKYGSVAVVGIVVFVGLILTFHEEEK